VDAGKQKRNIRRIKKVTLGWGGKTFRRKRQKKSDLAPRHWMKGGQTRTLVWQSDAQREMQKSYLQGRQNRGQCRLAKLTWRAGPGKKTGKESGPVD